MDHLMKADLDAQFRKSDPNNTGVIKKKDFVNTIFDNVRSLQPDMLANFLNVFTPSFENVINYDDFLKVLYKFGDMQLSDA